ncbi:unnamed protein product, partial [marine sediment metagenome]
FFPNTLFPILDKEMPYFRDLDHQWTRAELRKLCNIYTEVYLRGYPRVISVGHYLSPYLIASWPKCRTICEYGACARNNSRARGRMRQSGGGKLHWAYSGHAPTERYTQSYNIYDEKGLPLPHIWYYLFRPYLSGAHYAVFESLPHGGIQDIEGDGQWELSTLGYILKDLLDFIDRHPVRGITYSPVALMMDNERAWPSPRGTTYAGYNLPFDNADEMNNGLLNDLLSR